MEIHKTFFQFSCFYRIFINRAAKREGVVSRPRGGARYRKLDGDMVEKIIEIVEENPAITIPNIIAELRNRLPNKPPISETTVCRALHEQLISLKKLHYIPTDRNKDDVKRARQDYATWLLQEGQLRNLIFIDESGFNIWLKRTYGRARRGQRAFRSVVGQKGQNLSFKLAISPTTGMVAYSFHFGGTTSAIFNDFLQAVSEAANNNEVTYLIMDNAPCHKNAASRNPAHVVKFLPPHSPFLNPIENCFSAWKWTVKNKLSTEEIQRTLHADNDHETKAARRRRILTEVGTEAIATITPDKCQAWYRHSLTYLPKCQGLNDIFY